MKEIARRLPMLEVRCRRCQRSGRYRTAGLLARFGENREALLTWLRGDCPKQHERALWDRCSIYFPELPRVF